MDPKLHNGRPRRLNSARTGERQLGGCMKKPWLRLEPLHAAANDGAATSRQSASFPIVGVGASAGGLEAFTQLLSAIPSDSGMAFVLIQHLDPTHTSLLAEALTRATTMTVNPAEHGQRVAPNHV